MTTFQLKYEEYLTSLEAKQQKYFSGVAKLDDCNATVGRLQIELEALKPVLIQKTKETEDIMKQVEKETQVAEEQRLKVSDDEIETAQKAEIANGIQKTCKEKLSEAEPELEAAIAALKTLKIQDFIEMKSFQKPPALVRLVMDSVCIMMDRKPKKTAEKQEDYWDEAKKVLADPAKFLKNLENYKRESIPEKVIAKMTKFLNDNKNFEPKVIQKASNAGEGLCKWVKAIYKFHFVFQAILPLREDLARANKALEDA